MRRVGWWSDPWRRPWVLMTVTLAYLVWSLLPVLIAVLFSFNAGRSRVTWQGFSMRWYYGDPSRLAEFEALAMEDNVVEWALSKMKVEDKTTDFDELMGTKKG